MKNRNVFWGLLFVFAGILWIANTYLSVQIFNAKNMWPLFVLLPGICFELCYVITKKTPGMLLIGGILTITGLLFAFEQFTEWKYSNETWPVYLIALAVGLLQYFLVVKKKSFLIISILLILVAVCAFINMFFGNVFKVVEMAYVVPGIMILIGLAFLFNAK